MGNLPALEMLKRTLGTKCKDMKIQKQTFSNINEHKIQNYKKGVVNYLATKNTQKLKAINLSGKK